MYSNESITVAQFCKQNFRLSEAKLGDEYYYQHLSLCVIDAIFSINARYSSVQNVVERYCRFYNLQNYRNNYTCLPDRVDQESISTFLKKFNETSLETFTTKIFNNRCRTSSRSGILKSEAVFQFASVLQVHAIEYLQDVPNIISNVPFEQSIISIPGQTSGLSLRYFLMLAGSDDLIKPDRMIVRFLQMVLNKSITPKEAQCIISEASFQLRDMYPTITPRFLDNVIWKWQRVH